MRGTWIVLSALLVACGGTTPAPGPGGDAAGSTTAETTKTETTKTEAAATTEGSSEAGASTEAATKGLSPAKLEEAKGLINPFQRLEDAKPKLIQALGEPQEATDAGMKWFAKDGDKCKVLSVGVMGTSVGAVELKTAKCPDGI